MTRWLERYRAGDRVQVWAEMTSLGADLRDAPDWADAVAVARETMTRARTNVERLIELLPAGGYRFRQPREAVLVPPLADIDAQLQVFETKVGRLPLAVRAWYEHVGQVDLTGSHPDWDFEYTDPLVLNTPLDYLAGEFEIWEAEQGTEWDMGAFVVELGPDMLHKADVSGGTPYGIAVPNEGVDGLVLWERHQTTFVNYLRIAFAWAGLPGWDRGALDGWAQPSGPTPPLIREIADQLLPI